MRRYLGIDPGASGGLAVRGDGYAMGYKMPATERDIADLFVEIGLEITMALIERVHSFPGQGVSSSFAFGKNYGFLRGMLIAYGIPFEDISPQRWQKALGCLTGGDKNVSKQKAQQLFPQLKITHATADALLISEYGWRVFASLTEEVPPCHNPPVGQTKSRKSSKRIQS